MKIKAKIIDCKSKDSYSSYIGQEIVLIGELVIDSREYYKSKLPTGEIINVLKVDTLLNPISLEVLNIALSSKKKALNCYSQFNKVNLKNTISDKEEIKHLIFTCLSGANSASEVHNMWVVYMKNIGWKYGVNNNSKEKTSNLLRNYDTLPQELQIQEELVFSVVSSVIKISAILDTDNRNS